MARQSLATLITRVRKLINDPAGASQFFSDDEIQTILDHYRDDVRLLPLGQVPILLPSQQIVYLEYYSDTVGGDWEEDVVIQNSSFQILTPDTSDYQVGHWSFLTQPLFPLLLTGKQYDLYGAAADLLEERSAAESLSFDFSADNQQFKLSQKSAALQRLAGIYRSKSKPRKAKISRDDINAGSQENSGILDNWLFRNY